MWAVTIIRGSPLYLWQACYNFAMKMKTRIWVVLLVILLIISGVILWFSPMGVLLRDRELLLVWMQSYGRWAPLVIIGLHILQVLSAPIPGTALDAVNGLLYGPWLGTLYSMIGLTSGSWLAMLLARRFGRPLVQRYVENHHIERLDGLIQRYGKLFIFLVFLIPFLPDDALCFLAGLTPFPIAHLLLLVIFGRLPGVFMANWLGSNSGGISGWQWFAVGVIFVVLILLFWRYRKALPEILLRWVESVAHWLQKVRRKNE
ncbi:MAG: hypothetical protein CVU39_01660 [Chloroflexi bacterium HGW-Chloroflexi-10]|nr:MAG: hypothetical protein CVU39_01660 [Chloroflexi bacterium HGW-Chloroflexi-10]